MFQDEAVYSGIKLTTTLTNQNGDNIPILLYIQEIFLKNEPEQIIQQMEKEVNNCLICAH